MTQSGVRPAASRLIEPGGRLRSFLLQKDIKELLEQTHVNWTSGQLVSAPTIVREILEATDLAAASERSLSPESLRLLGRLQLDLVAAAKGSSLTKKYEIISPLARGSNSVTLRARNRRIGSMVVLKVLRPARAEEREQLLRQLTVLQGIPRLVAPIDAEQITAQTISGDMVELHCLVYPLIDAETFADFVKEKPPITPYFFEEFIRQVGGVLAILEEKGLEHGDLHGGNILVSTDQPQLSFTVIDPSPGLAHDSPFTNELSDLEWFRGHTIDALTLLQRHIATLSIEKHLGPRLFFLVQGLIEGRITTFRELLRLSEKNPAFEAWQRRRAEFISRKFHPPPPLGLLRWEEIADPTQAVELFEPYPELFARVKSFGNALVVGARGSGKSTYLAALAYSPRAQRQLVPPQEIVGVLFSCRQGEFKQLTPEGATDVALTSREIKHILVLKIIRKTLGLFSTALNLKVLKATTILESLYLFAERFIAEGSSLPRVGSDPVASMDNLYDGFVRWEEMEMRRLLRRNRTGQDRLLELLDERVLLAFFADLRRQIAGLEASRFYLLFDDAGEPNIPLQAQRALNDLLTSSNAVFCVKLSAERFSYDLRDSAGRTLEETHDFTSFDIASVYSSENGIDQSRAAIKSHFAQMLGRRLQYWGYPTTDITAYLGDQLNGSALPVKELVYRLAEGRKNAYYSGWEVVWQLADKTARSLIEMVSEIFAHANVRPPIVDDGRSAHVIVVSARMQDRAIRAVSNRRLRGLEYVPGEIAIKQAFVPLGRHLYLCAASFGAVSHRYLTRKGASKGGRRRLDERLAIERNDTAALGRDAAEVLKMLVRYGVFDDSNLNVAFDDGQKKPVYVFNRIFCPAFGISFRRDAHLRLSAGKLETFLLSPAEFVGRGSRFLRGLESAIDVNLKLFD